MMRTTDDDGNEVLLVRLDEVRIDPDLQALYAAIAAEAMVECAEGDPNEVMGRRAPFEDLGRLLHGSWTAVAALVRQHPDAGEFLAEYAAGLRADGDGDAG